MSTNASDGVVLDLEDLDITFNWAGTTLNYAQVVYRGNTYRQTYTYSGGVVTGISRWVKQ